MSFSIPHSLLITIIIKPSYHRAIEYMPYIVYTFCLFSSACRLVYIFLLLPCHIDRPCSQVHKRYSMLQGSIPSTVVFFGSFSSRFDTVWNIFFFVSHCCCFLFYMFFFCAILSPFSHSYAGFSFHFTMPLDFPFRFVFCELKTIFTFICKYFLFVCVLYIYKCRVIWNMLWVCMDIGNVIFTA